TYVGRWCARTCACVRLWIAWVVRHANGPVASVALHVSRRPLLSRGRDLDVRTLLGRLGLELARLGHAERPPAIRLDGFLLSLKRYGTRRRSQLRDNRPVLNRCRRFCTGRSPCSKNSPAVRSNRRSAHGDLRLGHLFFIHSYSISSNGLCRSEGLGGCGSDGSG